MKYNDVDIVEIEEFLYVMTKYVLVNIKDEKP